MRKILLNKSRSKESVDKTNFIPVELNREMSLLHDETLSDTIDALKVYDNEKNASTKHRFIFTLYPLCTNILFNKITEIVYKEGSNLTDVLTNNKESSTLIRDKGQKSAQTLNRIQAIRNTEYSNKNFEFTYHCGLDIFNNHLLRAKEDVSVQKKYKSESSGCTVYLDINSNAEGEPNFRTLSSDGFNTIGDVVRNNSGQYVYTYLPNPRNYYLYTNNFNVVTPLYLFDTIHSFEEGYKNSIKRQEGWIGFNNPSTLRMPVGTNTTSSNSASGASVGENEIVEGYYVNHCINSKEGCEFVDLYPERDLFSFTPKKNVYRQRIEKNWDYCLTYPYKSVYNDPTNTILKGKKFGIIFVKNEGDTTYREYAANNGIEMALFCSPVKHNLKVGDKVYLNFAQKQDNTFLGRVKCSVVSLGRGRDYKDRYFSVRMSDFHDYIDSEENEIVGFTKVAQGNLMCEYYFRLFKKFDGNYDSVLNRLAFSGTVYGDDVSQIVYTDDIDIKDYRDNHGRPLTEVYLTILKANRGHKEWYEDKDYTNSNIEFSHAFGQVTSGLDLPDYISNKVFPSIRYQHNINKLAFDDYFEKANNQKTVNESSSKLESDITIEEDTFYGDFVEFNPVTLNETILEDVYHRFNTAQREYFESDVTGELYDTLYYDEIASDIYDANTITTTKPSIRNYTLNAGYANIDPEGYIYKPHHKITIGQFENTINQGDDTIMKVSNVKIKINKNNYQLSFETSLSYSLLPTDIVAMVSKDNDLFKFIVTSYTWDGDKNTYVGVANIYSGDTSQLVNTKEFLDSCQYFKHNLNIPDYAYMLPDGSGRHLWKDLQQPSTWSFTDELYNTTFTNGAFYHHQNIVFPVRRQDPFEKYGMCIMDVNGSILTPMQNNFKIRGTEFDNSNVDFITPNNSSSCF